MSSSRAAIGSEARRGRPLTVNGEPIAELKIIGVNDLGRLEKHGHGLFNVTGQGEYATDPDHRGTRAGHVFSPVDLLERVHRTLDPENPAPLPTRRGTLVRNAMRCKSNPSTAFSKPGTHWPNKRHRDTCRRDSESS